MAKKKVFTVKDFDHLVKHNPGFAKAYMELYYPILGYEFELEVEKEILKNINKKFKTNGKEKTK